MSYIKPKSPLHIIFTYFTHLTYNLHLSPYLTFLLQTILANHNPHNSYQANFTIHQSISKHINFIQNKFGWLNLTFPHISFHFFSHIISHFSIRWPPTRLSARLSFPDHTNPKFPRVIHSIHNHISKHNSHCNNAIHFTFHYLNSQLITFHHTFQCNS